MQLMSLFRCDGIPADVHPESIGDRDHVRIRRRHRGDREQRLHVSKSLLTLELYGEMLIIEYLTAHR